MEPSAFWSLDAEQVLAAVESTPTGLTQAEAGRRLTVHGPNRVGAEHHASDRDLLLRQFRSPIMILLVGATVLSAFLGDTVDASIILAILLISGLLGFVQERGAVHAVRALLAAVQVHADVLRDGAEREVALADVVLGDIVVLRAGDLVPADCRLLAADNLLLDESALTGEAYPVHKEPATVPAEVSRAGRRSGLFLGTHVISGSGRAVVAATGPATELGRIGTHLVQTEPPTSFERGLSGLGAMLVRAGAVLVVGVFVVNLAFHRPVLESVLFSLALAVGITPQLLPAIITLTLSRGAAVMAEERVIVKRLSSIEDFGAMDELCVDKTGTLTVGALGLADALDLRGRPDPSVAIAAWRNAAHQKGFHNPIDEALLAALPTPADPGRYLDEVPYDFTRKRLSVAVAWPGRAELITKGAVTSVLEACSTARLGDQVLPIDEVRQDVLTRYRELGEHGLRVLAVATRPVPVETREVVDADEHDLTLVGLLTFADPPKPTAPATIERLTAAGIGVRMVTGDNQHAASHVAAAVGLATDTVLTGAEIEAMDDAALAERAGSCQVFAEVEPAHKERIVRALSRSGHSVGFLGDGINDALALRAADVGISVDSAVDVAKASASIVLLDKDLDVLLVGVQRGRQSFANTMKYVQVTTSANFGNMVSLAGATLLLPFLPLLPRQVLLLNLLSDVPAMAIAGDAVDPELLTRPTRWDVRRIRLFMIVFGLVSSVIDYVTFGVLWFGAHAGAEAFRTGWFLVSLMTELLAMLVLRTRRAAWRSRPGRALLALSVVVAAVAAVTVIADPTGVAAQSLGFTVLPAGTLTALLAVLLGYVALTESAKRLTGMGGGR